MRRFWIWVRLKWQFPILVLLPLLLTYYCANVPNAKEILPRYGVALQIVGYFVLWGLLDDALRTAGQPGLFAAIRMRGKAFRSMIVLRLETLWLKVFRPSKVPFIAQCHEQATGAATESGTAWAWFNAGPNPDVNARLEAIEKNLIEVRDELFRTQSKIKGHAASLSQRIDDERMDRNSADKGVVEQVNRQVPEIILNPMVLCLPVLQPTWALNNQD